MKVFGKNVFNELKDNVKAIKKVYLANNFNDKEIIDFIKNNKISYSTMDIHKMDGMVEGKHQGIIIVVDDYEYVDYKTMLNDNIVVMLDHLEDPHNFGAIIRTCEAAGIKSIIIPKDRSVSVYAADMDGENYKNVSYADKVLLVIGSEGNGVGRLVKKNCDVILAIPQYGHVNSLNASVAAAILIYGIVNK